MRPKVFRPGGIAATLLVLAAASGAAAFASAATPTRAGEAASRPTATRATPQAATPSAAKPPAATAKGKAASAVPAGGTPPSATTPPAGAAAVEPAAPNAAGTDSNTRTAAVTPTPERSAGGVPGDYLVGPGDTIQVFVWMNPELSANVAVRPDGKISTPLVEDMVAAGKTPSALARDIEGVLGEFVRQPRVNVIVTQAVSTYRQIKVVGQVRAPQSLAYRDGLSVLDAILAVGGVTEFAAANRARIVRTEGGAKQEIRVRLGDLVDKGDLDENVPLRPGDVLVVPESFF